MPSSEILCFFMTKSSPLRLCGAVCLVAYGPWRGLL
uniref:Uncharacterized protein n=1 Tax=Rhizophora mucronata TaxID=61149 RepID=A0A2P2J795_RHIMU